MPLTDSEDASANLDRAHNQAVCDQGKPARTTDTRQICREKFRRKWQGSHLAHLDPTFARGHRRQRPRDRLARWRPASARRRLAAAPGRTGSARSRGARKQRAGAPGAPYSTIQWRPAGVRRRLTAASSHRRVTYGLPLPRLLLRYPWSAAQSENAVALLMERH